VTVTPVEASSAIPGSAAPHLPFAFCQVLLKPSG
jgi:hypothetical protein